MCVWVERRRWVVVRIFKSTKLITTRLGCHFPLSFFFRFVFSSIFHNCTQPSHRHSEWHTTLAYTLLTPLTKNEQKHGFSSMTMIDFLSVGGKGKKTPYSFTNLLAISELVFLIFYYEKWEKPDKNIVAVPHFCRIINGYIHFENPISFSVCS